MEQEGLLPWQKELQNDPYPEPNKMSLHFHIPPL
jgi:hypothetical protein